MTTSKHKRHNNKTKEKIVTIDKFSDEGNYFSPAEQQQQQQQNMQRFLDVDDLFENGENYCEQIKQAD